MFAMTRRPLASAIALIVLLGACGSTNTGKVAPRNRNLITADEISQSNATTAYDAVKRLRPSFLQTRGATPAHGMEAPTPVVYVDGSLYGTLSTLNNISASSIFTIEYLNAMDATQRYGIGHDAGAILVVTRP